MQVALLQDSVDTLSSWVAQQFKFMLVSGSDETFITFFAYHIDVEYYLTYPRTALQPTLEIVTRINVSRILTRLAA